MKNIKKTSKVWGWIGVGILSGLVLFNASACNKKEQNVGPEDPKPPVEQTTVSASDLLDEMNEEGNIEGALRQGAAQKLAEKLANQGLADGQSAEVESVQIDGEKLSVIYKKHFSSNKDDFAFASIVADLPNELKAALATNWKDLILDKMSQNLIDESQLDAAKAEVNEIVDEVIESLASGEAKVEQSNTYVRNNTQVNGATMSALREKFGEDISVGEVRSDESVVVTSLDNDSLVEHLCQIYYTGTGETYEQIVTPDSKVNFVEKNIDISKPYAEPALRSTVTAQELFNQVFGEGFVLPTYEELLQEIAKRVLTNVNMNILATGTENNDFCIYTQAIDTANRDSMYKIKYAGSDQTIASQCLNFSNTAAIIDFALKDTSDYYINSYLYDSVFNQLNNASNVQDIIENIRNVPTNEWRCLNVLRGTTDEIGDFNEYGAKLLEDVKYNKIIKTVVGWLGGREIDMHDYFDTGYVKHLDISILYEDAKGLNLYSANLVVPYYIDLDDVALYKEILDGKHKIASSSLTSISDSIILTDQGVEKQESELANGWEYEAETMWLDERKRTLS